MGAGRRAAGGGLAEARYSSASTSRQRVMVTDAATTIGVWPLVSSPYASQGAFVRVRSCQAVRDTLDTPGERRADAPTCGSALDSPNPNPTYANMLGLPHTAAAGIAASSDASSRKVRVRSRREAARAASTAQVAASMIAGPLPGHW